MPCIQFLITVKSVLVYLNTILIAVNRHIQSKFNWGQVKPNIEANNSQQKIETKYRVSHSEECKVNKLWGVKWWIILLNYGA